VADPTEVRTLDELFRIPPEQFTRARNRLAAELRRAGKAPAAAGVAKLPRPSAVVWAINQAVHQDRAAAERLLDAATRVKRAQLGGAPGDVPAALRTYRDAVGTLAERSVAQLRAAGRATTAATRNRLTSTLMAAATDAGLRELLRAGRLNREAVATGFDVFGDARPALRVLPAASAGHAGGPEAAARPRPPAEDREAARRRAEAEVRLRTARADLAGAEARARELASTAARLARDVAEARERARAARRAEARGRADVAHARAKVKAAERAAGAPRRGPRGSRR
jgi:hypothetical protein